MISSPTVRDSVTSMLAPTTAWSWAPRTVKASWSRPTLSGEMNVSYSFQKVRPGFPPSWGQQPPVASTTVASMSAKAVRGLAAIVPIPEAPYMFHNTR